MGNGFSIACKPDIFTYQSLLKHAKFKSDNLNDLFKRFKTQDFEQIIRVLNDSAKVVRIYKNKHEFVKLFKSDAEELKQELIRILCEKHPSYPAEINESQYKSCATFLANFDKIYTLNYDLLLYWTILQDKDSDKQIKKIDDGFRREDEEYLHWNIENSNSQNIYYLHGALHILDSGFDLIKLEWEDYGKTLITQISERLNESRFPLFVAEGNSKEKLAKINHSAYLSRSYKSFSDIGGNLFIYGHSLADNDAHILDLIPRKTKIQNLFVSIYGDIKSKDNQKIVEKATSYINIRNIKNSKSINKKGLYPINVYFYDSNTTNVWKKGILEFSDQMPNDR